MSQKPWDKRQFEEEIGALRKESFGIALLGGGIFWIACLLFDLGSVAYFGIYIVALVYAIAQRARYKIMIQDAILLKHISPGSAKRLIDESDPEEEKFFSLKGIAYWVITGALVLFLIGYNYMKHQELKEHGAVALGKVIEVRRGKNPDVVIEYEVAGKKYTIDYPIYFSEDRGCYVYKDLYKKYVVTSGDLFSVVYSTTDPENSEIERDGLLRK